jgi:hypothetical protein
METRPENRGRTGLTLSSIVNVWTGIIVCVFTIAGVTFEVVRARNSKEPRLAALVDRHPFVLPPSFQGISDTLSTLLNADSLASHARRWLQIGVKHSIDSSQLTDFSQQICDELRDRIEKLSIRRWYPLEFSSLLSIDVVNSGSYEASGVVLQLPDRGLARVTLEAQGSTVTRSGPTIALGDIPPQTKATVIYWGQYDYQAYGHNIKLISTNTVGRVSYVESAAGTTAWIVRNYDFISFMLGFFFYVLIVPTLVVVVVQWIVNLVKRRKNRSPQAGGGKSNGAQV